MKNEIQINGNAAEWEQQCRQLAEKHKHFVIVNFNLDKMRSICNSIAKEFAYELNIVLKQPSYVCHFIPRASHSEAIPLEFSGNPEDQRLDGK
jgi:hypothetical protein